MGVRINGENIQISQNTKIQFFFLFDFLRFNWLERYHRIQKETKANKKGNIKKKQTKQKKTHTQTHIHNLRFKKPIPKKKKLPFLAAATFPKPNCLSMLDISI